VAVRFHLSPPTAKRSNDAREMRTLLPILWTGSFFVRISLSKVRIEMERACAAWRLLSSICSGMFASLRVKVIVESQKSQPKRRTGLNIFRMIFVQKRSLASLVAEAISCTRRQSVTLSKHRISGSGLCLRGFRGAYRLAPALIQLREPFCCEEFWSALLPSYDQTALFQEFR